MLHELPQGFPSPAPADPPDVVAGLMRAADDWRRGDEPKATADIEALANRLEQAEPRLKHRSDELLRIARGLQLLLAARGVGLSPESIELSSRDLESVHIPDLTPAPVARARAYASHPIRSGNFKTTLRSESLKVPSTVRSETPGESPRPPRELRTTLPEGMSASSTFIGTPAPFARVIDFTPASDPSLVTKKTALPLLTPFEPPSPPPDSMPTMPMTLIEGGAKLRAPTPASLPIARRFTSEPKLPLAPPDSNVPDTPRSITPPLTFSGLSDDSEPSIPTAKVDSVELPDKLKR